MAGPSVRRRQLGKALRELRTNAHENREEAAIVLDCSPSKITYLESGRNVIGKAELIVLLQHYNAVDKLPVLNELRAEANKRGWWSTARLPEWLANYVGLESEAATVRCFELTLIPGLLQTEQYVRELHAPQDLERRVKARLRRQERLTTPDPLILSAVISEEALHRCAQQPTVAGEQFRQLANWAQLTNIDIRVLPLSVGLHACMQGGFTLLSFPEDVLADVGWQEYALGGHIIDDTSDVASLTRLYNELRGQALATDKSLTMISEFVDKQAKTDKRSINDGGP